MNALKDRLSKHLNGSAARRTIELSWYDDLKLESDLTRMGVNFRRVSIPFSKLNLKESQVNGARTGRAILPHKVEDYMQGFRNGDTFPCIVVYKTAAGYIILGGNQRSEAIRRLIAAGDLPKSVEIEVYLVDTTDNMLLQIIARSANAAHGEGMTKEERIQHAIYCVRTLGMAKRDAAAMFLVSEITIRENIKAEDTRALLQQSGIDAHHVANNTLATLAKLDYDESAQVKIGKLAAQHNPPNERIKQVVARVDKQGTPSGRAQAIKEFEKELSAELRSNGHSDRALPEQTRIPRRPRRDTLITYMSRLVNFLEFENAGEPFTSLEQLQVTTAADKANVHDLAKKLRTRLGVICK